MRIGIAHPYDLGVPGGVDSHVRQLAVALTARGHDVVTLAPGRAPRERGATVTGRAVPLRVLGSVARIAPWPTSARRAARWVRGARLDVLHVHEPAVPSASAQALRAARRSGVPVVATFHASIDGLRALRPLRGVVRRHLGAIDARLAVSAEAARTQREWLGADCEVVPNGIDVAAFRPVPAADPGSMRPRDTEGRAAHAGPRVVFLGRADEPRKGLTVLAAAWPSVRAAHPGARLLVAGPGEEAAHAMLGDLPGVDVLGRLPEHEKIQLLRGADAFVAPHLGGESFGIVLVEAMAAGAPVVASDLPAFTAVLGADPQPSSAAGDRSGTDEPPESPAPRAARFGLLARRGDSSDLAARIDEALTDRAGARQRADLAAREVGRYDWSVVAAQVERAYLRATSSRAAGDTTPSGPAGPPARDS